MKALVCIAVAGFCLVTSTLNAQDIEARLAGSTTSSGFSVLDNNRLQLFTVRGNGRVGIGNVTPDASLHIIGQIKITGGNPGAGKLLTSDAAGLATWQTPAGSGVTLDEAYDHGGQGAGRTITADAGAVRVAGVDGFLVTGTAYSAGSIPATGAGVRMMFYPKKAAFRAGNVSGTQWDDANIGQSSVAMGAGTIASGDGSTSTGVNNTASDYCSTAMGYHTTASGSRSTSMGNYTVASGTSSTATGNYTTASGNFSTAMGSRVRASKDGSFVIGDQSTTTTNLDISTANRFAARFANGYYLYTTTSGEYGIGAGLAGNANSWSTVSDSTLKTNFVNADGETVLAHFRDLRLGSWNYKCQDAEALRHYGPMAQEWFAAFGHDGIGTIGNDTTLSSADVDGVLCIAVKALEKRTAVDRDGLSALQVQLADKDREIAELRQQLSAMQEGMQTMRREFATFRAQQQSAAPRFVQASSEEAVK